MIDEFRSLTREHYVSLIAACVFLGFCFSFPIRNTSFLEALTVFAVFLCVVPTLYAYFVLKRSLDELVGKPLCARMHIISFGASTIFGIIMMTALYFSPFMDNYKVFVTPFFAEFESFIKYEILYLIPLLLLATYYCIIFVGALHLPKNVSVLFSTIFLNAIFINFFSFPFYSTLLFFGGVIYLHTYLKASHPLSILASLWIPLLVFDTIIAKSL